MVCVREREKESVGVCLQERERERVCVCGTLKRVRLNLRENLHTWLTRVLAADRDAV